MQFGQKPCLSTLAKSGFALAVAQYDDEENDEVKKSDEDEVDFLTEALSSAGIGTVDESNDTAASSDVCEVFANVKNAT